MAEYQIVISVNTEVANLSYLLAAAIKHAVEIDGMDEESARDLLTNSDPLGRADVKSCLIMLFDPGVSPDGVSILGTDVERADMDEDDAMDAYEAAHGEEPDPEEDED